MKLVFIYGPPAVGKLTVARELGRITSYRVFDNHLSFDCVLPVFDFGTPSFGKLVKTIRLAVLDEAAREDVNVIFTFVYAYPDDTSYVEDICGAVEPHGGEVCFVQLTCDRAEQDRRVERVERHERAKIRTVEHLRAVHEIDDLFTPVTGRDSLRIDNTTLPAAEVAAQIAAHYGLMQS